MLFRLPDGDRLLLAIHHLVVDAVSWRILLEEVELAYRQITAGETIALGPPSCSFGRWAEGLQAFGQSEGLAAEASYWSRIGRAEVTRLPTAQVDAPLHHGDAETLHRALSAEATAHLLTQAHRAFQTEIMDLLLAALGRALKRWSGGDAARITLEGHGREPPDDALDLSRTVGWFTSVYPFVVSVAGDDVSEQIRSVKSALRERPRKGLGYGILRYVTGTRVDSEKPQLSFNYLGQLGEGGDDGQVFRHGRRTERQRDCPERHARSRARYRRACDWRPFDPVARIRSAKRGERRGGGVARGSRAAGASDRTDCLSRLPELGDERPSNAEISPTEVPHADAVEESYPLSPLQEGFLFQSLLEPTSDSDSRPGQVPTHRRSR